MKIEHVKQNSGKCDYEITVEDTKTYLRFVRGKVKWVAASIVFEDIRELEELHWSIMNVLRYLRSGLKMSDSKVSY